ncbi:MAG: 3-oxoacyl-(acyl-carrier-protein) synthase 2 [Solirubrobacterales bacterium]|jgi:3-oxoacyl-[acyl-carrier-protein] synthase II|nr:3-oxoacyl-(acyl-carrier-protein) synthase 2 [Solirubrobacterales bacterium]
MRDVVITGVGAVTPLGVGARTLHERWTAGVCGIVDGEAPCTGYEAGDHFSRKEVRRNDRFTQLALVAAAEAVAEAGWADGDGGLPVPADRAGAIIGTGIGGIWTLLSSYKDLLEGGQVGPLAVPLMMGNAGAAAVAMKHDLEGPAFGVMSACAAGTNAIGVALRAIQHGEADVMLAGGSEAALHPLTRAAFGALDATSTLGICRPFDSRRDGFVMGEGAGVLVLEAGDVARARGATILATLGGYGTTCDAHHLTAPREDGARAAAAISIALNDAGYAADAIDYVNAHGTSTPLNDAAETAALKTALGAHAMKIPVSSTKSAIGHLLGAAGAVEAVATVLALRDRVAPPTLGHEQPGEGLDLDYVPGKARAMQVPDGRRARAISTSFGFGGHNAVLALEAA